MIYLFTALQEQSIAQFHNIGLVHAGHLLAIILCGIIKGKLSDAH